MLSLVMSASNLSFFLAKISVRNYRGFFEKQEVNFATPTGLHGSGLTLLVGPNMTGKSSFLETLHMLDSRTAFDGSERHGSKRVEIEITLKDKSNGELIQPIIIQNIAGNHRAQHKHHIQVSPSSTGYFTLDLIHISAQRYWHPWHTSGNLTTGGGKQIFRIRHLKSEPQILGKLEEILKDERRKSVFDTLLKRIIPNFSDWSTEMHQGESYIKYVLNQKQHQLDYSGDGLLSLFYICAELLEFIQSPSPDTGVGNQKRILILDEPELYLHPSAQKELAEIIAEISANAQVVICSHSTYFVNWRDYINGASFVRFNQDPEGQCVISQLKKESAYSAFVSNNLAEWQKPQLLGTAAKEILFADAIFFVEGQEDKGLITKWLMDSNQRASFDIFGYGVGGYSNMKLFLAMAEDLRLTKVSALYDKGVDSSEALQGDKEYFSKNASWLFIELPTEDIRKKVGCHKCNHGCKCEKTPYRGLF